MLLATPKQKLQRKQELEQELLKAEQELKCEHSSLELQGDIFEKVLKQIVKSVIEEVNNKGRARELHDYPPVLQAHHIKELLGISSGKTYEILRGKGCPMVRDEKRMTVPRDLFWEWYLNRARENMNGGDYSE